MSIPSTTSDLSTVSSSLKGTGGLLRLTPDRVQRLFLQPGAHAMKAYRNA